MAEHDLNKIVDDSGEVFNLRDVTKLPKTSDPSKIVSAAYPQCFESTDFYNQGYLVLYNVTSAFDGTFDNVTTDAAHVAFSGFVQSCKYNGGGAPQFYKIETKINGKYPYNYNYSTSKTYGPVVLKRTYEEEGVTHEQYFLAVKIPANYSYGLMLFGVFHTRGLTGTSLSWDDGFLGTFVALNNDEYVVNMTWSAGENVAAEANIAKAYDTTFTGTNSIKSAIDAKANDSSVLHKSGQETASGQKWFEGGFCVFNDKHVGYGHFTLGGTASGTAYNNWPEEQKDGAHFREWSLSFNTGVNFWGKIRLTICTAYSSFNASGSLQKTINCAFNTSTVYNNTGYYNDLGINSEKEFRISDLIWNNTTSCWEIKIHSIKPTSNNTISVLLIEFWTYSTSHRDSALGIHWVSATPSIVTDTTYFTKRSGNAATSPTTSGETFNWEDQPVLQSPYGYEIFDRSHTIPINNGGTGKTTAKAAEYNLTTGKSEISDTTSGDDRVVFELASPSESNGVTRGFRKLSTIWTWIKGQISSVLGLSENGYTGNAATATAFSSGIAKTKFDGIADGATKVESSTTNGNIKINGTETTVYTHPTNGANTSKGDTTDQTPSFGHTFKVLSATVDSQGHTTALADHTVTIPNTVVTGGNSGEAGLMSPADKDKVEALGTASTKNVPSSGNASTSQVVMGNDTRLTDARTPTAHSHNTDADEVTDNTAASGLAVVTDTTEIVTTNTDGYSSNDKKLYRRPLKTKLWPWIKGLLSSESGVNISGSSASCTGNAATATSADTATRLGGVRVIENETDTRIKLVNVPTLGSYTWIKWQCLITVENAGGYGNKGTSIVLLAKGDAQGQTRYNHKLTILSNNNWNLSRYRPMIWNVANGDGIDAVFGVWDAVDNHLETYSEIRVTVTIFPGNIQNATYQLTHDAGTWSAATTYLTTFASSSCTEIVDYGRADVPSDTDKIVRVGWNKSAVPVVTPDSSYEYSSGQTVSATAYLVAAYGYDGVGYYKDVQAGNVTVGNSQKWNGYSLVVGSSSSSPAANTLYIF